MFRDLTIRIPKNTFTSAPFPFLGVGDKNLYESERRLLFEDGKQRLVDIEIPADHAAYIRLDTMSIAGNHQVVVSYFLTAAVFSNFDHICHRLSKFTFRNITENYDPDSPENPKFWRYVLRSNAWLPELYVQDVVGQLQRSRYFLFHGILADDRKSPTAPWVYGARNALVLDEFEGFHVLWQENIDRSFNTFSNELDNELSPLKLDG